MCPAEILENDYVFCSGQVPWHGLGTVVENDLTAKEAIKTAKLDWKVDLTPVHYIAQRPGDEGPTLSPTTEWNVVVRMDTLEALGVVGNRYVPVQNNEAFEFFDKVVGEGQAIYHTAGSLFNGRKIWILAKLPEPVMVGGRDCIDQYLLLHNVHDGSRAVIMMYTPVRVVCNNTLSMALSTNTTQEIKIRHTSNVMNSLEATQIALGFAEEKSTSFAESVEQMVKIPFDDNMMVVTLDRLLDISEETTTPQKLNTKNKILELAEDGMGIAPYRGTLWGFLNAVTEYADHEKTMRIRRGSSLDLEKRKAEQHMMSVLMGGAATFKRNASKEIKNTLIMTPPSVDISVLDHVVESL